MDSGPESKIFLVIVADRVVCFTKNAGAGFWELAIHGLYDNHL
jgi:hypothetical protein